MSNLRGWMIVSALMVGGSALAQTATQTGLSPVDVAFLGQAAMSNAFEIQAGQLADQQANSDVARGYGQVMVRDHTRLGNQLAEAVQKVAPNFVVPQQLGGNFGAKLSVLQTAGSSFDQVYRNSMFSSHEATLKLFQNYAANPRANATIKAVVRGAIPVIQRHLLTSSSIPVPGSF